MAKGIFARTYFCILYLIIAPIEISAKYGSMMLITDRRNLK